MCDYRPAIMALGNSAQGVSQMKEVQFVLFMSMSMLSLVPLCFGIELSRNPAKRRLSACFFGLAAAMIMSPLLWA